MIDRIYADGAMRHVSSGGGIFCYRDCPKCRGVGVYVCLDCLNRFASHPVRLRAARPFNVLMAWLDIHRNRLHLTSAAKRLEKFSKRRSRWEEWFSLRHEGIVLGFEWGD